MVETVRRVLGVLARRRVRGLQPVEQILQAVLLMGPPDPEDTVGRPKPQIAIADGRYPEPLVVGLGGLQGVADALLDGQPCRARGAFGGEERRPVLFDER